jgi:large subunit ribosomal protein L24
MANKKNIVHADHFTAQRKMDIKKGDTVVVIAGKDKGKRGEVLEVRPRENRVIVENVNIVVKHEKSKNPQAGAHTQGRIETPAPLDRSNVMLVNPNTQEPTKVSHKQVDGKFVRAARKGGEII